MISFEESLAKAIPRDSTAFIQHGRGSSLYSTLYSALHPRRRGGRSRGVLAWEQGHLSRSSRDKGPRLRDRCQPGPRRVEY
jgi:hypothetical protein